MTFSILERDDASIAYGTAGELGPPVLLVQGTGAVGEGWRAQIDELARDHRVAWLDNRGIGASLPLRGPVTVPAMAGDCLALLDHLGWERAHLVGHSLGGLVVQEAARTAPGRASSLSLISTLHRGRDVLWMSPAAIWLSLQMRIGTERSRWRAFAELGMPREFLASAGEERMVDLLRRSFCEGFIDSPPIVARQIAALWRHTGGDMAPLRQVPTLIVTGAGDRLVGTRHSDELLALLPGARLERIPAAGHAIILQLPAQMSRLLREHIGAAEGARPAAAVAAAG